MAAASSRGRLLKTLPHRHFLNGCRCMGAAAAGDLQTWQSGVHAGWVGLGAMGYPMAGHAARVVVESGGGSEFAVWNRTRQKAASHASEFGSRAASSLDDLVECSVIFSCLPTTKEVKLLTEELCSARQRKGVTQDTVWVDCTSGDPDVTRELARQLEPCGIYLVDCPVSGGPRGASAGTVTAMLGGDAARNQIALPLIKAFAGKVEACGPVGAGMAIKCVNNLLNSAHLLIGTEALVVLKRAGIDPATALAVINKSSGRSLQTEVRLPEEVLTRRFGYGFKLGLMRKDCDTAALVVAKVGGLDSSLLAQASSMIAAAQESHGGEVDYTMLSAWVEEKAGISIAE